MEFSYIVCVTRFQVEQPVLVNFYVESCSKWQILWSITRFLNSRSLQSHYWSNSKLVVQNRWLNLAIRRYLNKSIVVKRLGRKTCVMPTLLSVNIVVHKQGSPPEVDSSVLRTPPLDLKDARYWGCEFLDQCEEFSSITCFLLLVVASLEADIRRSTPPVWCACNVWSAFTPHVHRLSLYFSNSLTSLKSQDHQLHKELSQVVKTAARMGSREIEFNHQCSKSKRHHNATEQHEYSTA
jgi:hypothetical protein